MRCRITKRVKVDFPLAKSLMHFVEQKVKGQGTLEFLVKYENVPHFYFGCGRIGHSQRECQMRGTGQVASAMGKLYDALHRKKKVWVRA